MHFFIRPVMPTFHGNMSAAVALLNMGNAGCGLFTKFTPASIGLDHPNGYTVIEVFENRVIKSVMPNDYVADFLVPPSGVKFLRFDVKPSQTWRYFEPQNQQEDQPSIDLGES